MVFGCFSWCLQWFRALDHQNHCKNQEKPRILDFERWFENCVFSAFSVFLGFYSGFELLITETTVKTKNNHEFWILRDSLKMVFFLVFSWR